MTKSIREDFGTTTATADGNHLAGDQRPSLVVGRHTPGPWTFFPNESGIEYEVVAADGGEDPWHVAICFGGIPNGQSLANAKLIAAAPDLLAALQFYARASVTSPTPGTNFRNCDDGRFAREAIAKALATTGISEHQSAPSESTAGSCPHHSSIEG